MLLNGDGNGNFIAETLYLACRRLTVNLLESLPFPSDSRAGTLCTSQECQSYIYRLRLVHLHEAQGLLPRLMSSNAACLEPQGSLISPLQKSHPSSIPAHRAFRFPVVIEPADDVQDLRHVMARPDLNAVWLIGHTHEHAFNA
jgi:hypothetical protein